MIETVKDLYTEHPFPNRNKFGTWIMQKDFIENMKILGISMKGKHILDAGCGTGELTSIMAKYAKWVDGIDISKSSIDIARGKNRKYNIDYFANSINYIMFIKRYDLVISHMVLHHCFNPRKAFANLCTAVKSKGEIVIRLFFLWGRLSPFQKSPLWKLWLVRALGRTPDERVKIAEKLFYREGDEAPHGLDKYTYLYDNYGIPVVHHHTFKEVLGWFKENGIEFLASNPPVRRYIRRFGITLPEWGYVLSYSTPMFTIAGRKK